MKDNCFIKKYKTPLGLQISSTLIFIIFPVLLFSLKIFDTLIFKGGILNFDKNETNIFSLFYWNYNLIVEYLAQIIIVVACIIGIVFIWFNRPLITLLTTIPMLIIMILTLFRKWEAWSLDEDGIMYYEGYFLKEYNDYREAILVNQLKNPNYYILWGVLGLVILLSVISLIATKKRTKNNTVVESPIEPENTFSTSQVISSTISSADEIKKYKELLDEGIITQEEFEKKKNKLLNL